MKKRKKGVSLIRSRKSVYDGVSFDSMLELYMYKILKKNNVKFEREKTTYELIPKFECKFSCIEKQQNGNGELKERNSVRAVTYTPDFEGERFIIECKGKANESFPYKWKMFKRLLNKKNVNITLYKPQNYKDCDVVLKMILKDDSNRI